MLLFSFKRILLRLSWLMPISFFIGLWLFLRAGFASGDNLKSGKSKEITKARRSKKKRSKIDQNWRKTMVIWHGADGTTFSIFFFVTLVELFIIIWVINNGKVLNDKVLDHTGFSGHASFQRFLETVEMHVGSGGKTIWTVMESFLS